MERSSGSPISSHNTNPINPKESQYSQQQYNILNQFKTYSNLGGQDGLLNLSQSSNVRVIGNIPYDGTYGSLGSLVYGSQGLNLGNLGQAGNYDDAKTIIQRLMNTKKQLGLRGQNTDRQFFQNETAAILLQNANPTNTVYPLEWTQNRIFNEVINLIQEIQQLKKTIKNVQQEREKLQIQRDYMVKVQAQKKKGGRNAQEIEAVIDALNSKDIQISKRYHQGQQPLHQVRLTYSQLQKIITENQQLQRIINQLELKQEGNIDQLLYQQRQRFRQLQRKFNEKKYQLRKINKDPQEIIQLKQKIIRLTEQCHKIQEIANSNQLDQQIEKLKDDNEVLRKRTIQVLETTKQEYHNREIDQERRRLENYIKAQEANKISFLQDLRKFKQQYNKIRQENKKLKLIIKERSLDKIQSPLVFLENHDQQNKKRQQPQQQQQKNQSQNKISRAVSQPKTNPNIESNQQSRTKISVSNEKKDKSLGYGQAVLSKYEDLTIKMKRIMG